MIDKDTMPSDYYITKIVQSIHANQLALHFNEELRFTPYYKHNLKRKLNPVLTELFKIEKTDYNHFLDTVEGNSDYLYALQDDVVKELTSLGLISFGEILNILKAYKKDRKSINGIARKINK